jgi:hypothetical protein
MWTVQKQDNYYAWTRKKNGRQHMAQTSASVNATRRKKTGRPGFRWMKGIQYATVKRGVEEG